MSFQFATCERHRALEFLKTLYPSYEITDSEDSAGKILDWVEKDVIRIPDPMMHGMRVGVRPSKNFKEEYRDELMADYEKFENGLKKSTKEMTK